MAQQAPARGPLVLLCRVLLLVGVLTGLGAMHVVAPGSAHAMTSMSSTARVVPAQPPAGAGPTTQTAASTAHALASSSPAAHPAPGGTAGGHTAMVGCVLFAATGITLLGALLGAAAARRRLTSLGVPGVRSLAARVLPARRGPPPPRRPRVALCVIRV